ncbi:MAG: stage 0 sporulation protein J [Chloroflexi bacterium HGW-Chloroflexi-3]|nr:MAG: stage 0 sporulation protein J [Chloroflexi bacterium HGW-Chloroflexi-3]
MAKKPGLGRGLDALIPGSKPMITEEEHQVSELPIEKILPNPHQPRTIMDDEELQELAQSIREHGIIQPLLVIPKNDREEYVLIAGERRLRAAKLAGLQKVPVIFRQASDQEHLELALIENVQRANLSPLETADAYQQLISEFNLSHEEIANRVGKSRVSVTNTIRLLKLPEKVKLALAKNDISEGHARAILALATPQAQSAVLDIVIKNNYSVRQTEELVKKYSGDRETKSPPIVKDPEIKALEERFQDKLGMRVNLDHRGDKGKIIIHYYSNEELNSLIDRFIED